MRVHIWCPRPSDSAVAIKASLKQHGVRTYKSRPEQSPRRLQKFLNRVRRGDLWINWGKPCSIEFPEAIVLNANADIDKQQQLAKLDGAQVPCLEVSGRPQGEGWLGRSRNHQEGRDLIHNTGHDYWTRKLEFIRELRVHVYKGQAIHTGLKVPRIDNPHEWIRSYDAGWKIDYSRAAEIAQSRRELAKKAVEVLGLDFGAVDIGIVRGGKATNAYVIEVNTAPGLDPGPSVEVYVNKFLEEINGRP